MLISNAGAILRTDGLWRLGRLMEPYLFFRTRSLVGLHHVYDPSHCMEFRFLDYQQYFCLTVASLILAL